MRFPLLCLFTLVLFATANAEESFVPMFNGHDLAGWHIKDSPHDQWHVSGDEIRCEPGAVGADGGGWLTSDREFADFILEVDWRIPTGGNSGIALRYPDEDEPAHMGMEIQLLDDTSAANSIRPADERSGSIYAELAPLTNADKPPGEWNHTTITCRGASLIIITNEVETLHVDLSELTVLHGPHSQYLPVSKRPRRGHIGLQGDRGMWVEFRNVRIKEL